MVSDRQCKVVEVDMVVLSRAMGLLDKELKLLLHRFREVITKVRRYLHRHHIKCFNQAQGSPVPPPTQTPPQFQGGYNQGPARSQPPPYQGDDNQGQASLVPPYQGGPGNYSQGLQGGYNQRGPRHYNPQGNGKYGPAPGAGNPNPGFG
ncbi:hypothetical protein Bca52824_011653 [Brassica carinata]|uniref:Uncharacterized protein n=1 Tax=Brassica carinata TaxID=52824 RepID=A0A8X7VWR5_BRACI|nr:hypothetical protein Bca52824_011653 [Brassica carinata]